MNLGYCPPEMIGIFEFEWGDEVFKYCVACDTECKNYFISEAKNGMFVNGPSKRTTGSW